MKTTIEIPDPLLRKAKAMDGGFGELRRLHKETARIQARIDKAFSIVEPEDRA